MKRLLLLLCIVAYEKNVFAEGYAEASPVDISEAGEGRSEGELPGEGRGSVPGAIEAGEMGSRGVLPERGEAVSGRGGTVSSVGSGHEELSLDDLDEKKKALKKAKSQELRAVHDSVKDALSRAQDRLNKFQ